MVTNKGSAMLGYSKTENAVFTLSRDFENRISPKIEIHSQILTITELTAEQWREVRAFQGALSVRYLRWKYGSGRTKLLLAYNGEDLVYVHWVVPCEKMVKRYPFVSPESYSFVSCLTASDVRGMVIYPASLQRFVIEQNSDDILWIWAARDNIASIKGIQKAGGKYKGTFVQTKRLWGLLSKVHYVAEDVS